MIKKNIFFNKKETLDKELQSFCNDIHDCNYKISTTLFQHILHLNSYEKIGYSEYYSLKNNNDLPNYLKAFKINDKEVSINIRAWMHKKPKDFYYHSRTIILKRLVPYLHRDTKPAFIENPFSYTNSHSYVKKDSINILYVFNGMLHSLNNPALCYDYKNYFFVWGKNKTDEFKESMTYIDNNRINEKNENSNNLRLDEDLLSKWLRFSKNDDMLGKIESVKDVKNCFLDYDVIDIFYNEFNNSDFIFYTLNNHTNSHDLPNLIVLNSRRDLIQKIWKNKNDELHREPTKPAIITYKDDLIKEDYYINGIEINDYSPDKKDFEKISDVFSP